jgi:protein SCO1/2
MMMAATSGVTQTAARLNIPATIELIRQDGKKIRATDAIATDEAVIVNFIYTTCTTICPVTSQVFSALQTRLEAHGLKARLISISIDPEQDTPKVLADYAKRFHAGPTWSFYTGTTQQSIDVQRAFGVYSGDKMNHRPVTFLRAAQGDQWIRLEGFPSADEVAMALHGMVKG